MAGKTIYQWIALISFVLGVSCVIIGLADFHGKVGTAAAFFIMPCYLLGLWCVLFKPVKK